MELWLLKCAQSHRTAIRIYFLRREHKMVAISEGYPSRRLRLFTR